MAERPNPSSAGPPHAADGTARDTALTPPDHWDRVWTGSVLSGAARFSYFHRALIARLMALCAPGDSAVELGCGGSAWLPMLASRGVDAWGIDYSEPGVARAQALLARHGVRGTVVHGDLFDPRSLPEGRFALVYSLGLLEHFSDSRAYVQRLIALAAPGAHVLTTVPNLRGPWGRLQRTLDATLFDAHRAYTPAGLDQAHTDGGLEVVQPARYFGGISPLVVEYDPVLRRLPHWAARGALGSIWTAQQALGWSMAWLPDRVRNPPSLAGHILGVYRRPL